jgi:exosortase D (VPLPA-CTERM-specific)
VLVTKPSYSPRIIADPQNLKRIMQALRLPSPFWVYTLFGVVAVTAIVPFAHVLGGLYNIWNLKPEYSHGVIIPVLSAFLIWRQRTQLRQLPFTGSWLGVALIAAGLALRFVGQLTTMQTFEHYAFLLVLYGIVLTLVGPAIFRRLWMPLLILIFALPLPSLVDNALSLQLQLISSQIGVWVIRAAGISVLLEGNVIDLGSYQLEVAEACSGLRYLFPLMTLAFILAYLFRGPMWKRAVVFLSSVPITVVMNSLRIGFIGITVEYWGKGMAEGVLHDFEGWLVFMLSTGTLLLTAFGLARIGKSPVAWRDAFNPGPEPAADKHEVRREAGRQMTLPRPFIAATVLVIVGAVANVAAPTPQTTFPSRTSFYEFPTHVGDWVGTRDALQSVYLDALRLDDYVLANFHGPDGQQVNFYAAYYQSQDSTRAIHSPHDCIPGGGWEITQFGQRTLPAPDGSGSFKVNRAIVQLGSHRQIVYYWFEERGRRLTSEYSARWYLFWDALTRHRTDGALVRFVATLPPGANESDVDARITRLATSIEPTLRRYVPG